MLFPLALCWTLDSKLSYNMLPQCLWRPICKETSVWASGCGLTTTIDDKDQRRQAPPYLSQSHNRPPVCSNYHCVCSLHSWTSTPWQPHQNSSGSLPNSPPVDSNLWGKGKVVQVWGSGEGPDVAGWMCLLFRTSFCPPAGGSKVKVSACNAGDLGSIPGSGRSPGEGNGNPFQYSCLENPMDGEAWWAKLDTNKV